ncbi:unnamed protein product [Polarella glacialis]|uniref:K Homology domain-containing protein n=1 Tax=Polarella glacialis TaxID=89957 RepID=A0A813LXE5_POLGL|nr:unnamed protein product [Polarella glacialis]
MLALIGAVIAVLLLVGLIWKLTSSGKSAPSGSSKKTPVKSAAKAAAKAPSVPKQKKEKEQAPEPKVEEPVASSADEAGAAEKGQAQSKAGKSAKTGKDDGKSAAKTDKKADKKAKAKPKANPKGGKTVAKNAQPEEAEEQDTTLFAGPPVVLDAGEADGWEVATSVPKKVALRQQRKAEEEEFERMAAAAARRAQGGPSGQGKAIPGMAPVTEAKPAAKAASKKEDGLKLTPEQEKAAAERAAMESQSVTVPEKMIGRVIGPKGATLKLIQEKTGVTKIDTSGEIFTVLGPPKAVALAVMAIRELCEKGYTSLSYDDFSTAFVLVHPSMFPEIIGKQGAVIKKFKEELQVEVGIPEIPPEAMKGTKKYKVTLAGSNAAVEKAKAALTDIVMVYHSEMTHPGIVHEEVEVEPWQLNWVIGTKGSEIRHIQNNFKVKFYISGQFSENPAHVIVGEPNDVTRAKAYIEKILYSEAKPTGRETASGKFDGDGWAAEEQHEDWMDGYIYKRR